ncbi:MAG: hypothetical protein U0235_22920 [Polyangiaceae bacterium]
MSIFRGSLTYARFFVEGEVPDDFRDRFMRSIRHRIQKPLEPEDEDLERTGWCLVGDAAGLELAYPDVFWNEYLNLGVRTDRWAIPGSLLRAKMREAQTAYLEKHGRERLSRKEKTELKDLVSKRLRQKLTPATRLVDFSWSLGEGIVRFFSHSPKAAVGMSELFHRTFGSYGLRLVPESPYTLASRLALTKAEADAWDGLECVVTATEEG